jgi:hypothetical protein
MGRKPKLKLPLLFTGRRRPPLTLRPAEPPEGRGRSPERQRRPLNGKGSEGEREKGKSVRVFLPTGFGIRCYSLIPTKISIHIQTTKLKIEVITFSS